jgi:hypothetical protein
MLKDLNQIVDIEDIFAYADDVLVICEDLDTLQKCIQIIERWSDANNMKINKTKSAILEFVHRYKRTTTLTIGDTLHGYPIVSQYKYLGTWLNQKLTIDTQIEHIIRKTNFIRSRLTPSLYNATLDFRKNLWQIFILPLYEFALPLYYYEEAVTKKRRMNLLLRKSFKSYTGLKKNVETLLIEDLMTYDLESRSQYIQYVSTQKWSQCLRGEMYYQRYDSNNMAKLKRPINLCKNQPKAMIKYINMQTIPCPRCKTKGIIVRCSDQHLRSRHDIVIRSVRTIMEKIVKLHKAEEAKKQKEKKKLTRKQMVGFAERMIQSDLAKLKHFLNLTA